MTLQEFLEFIQNEDVRIELEIHNGSSDEYKYHHFWLSDFGTYDDIAFKCFNDYTVSNFSFIPKQEDNAKIRISIKP